MRPMQTTVKQLKNPFVKIYKLVIELDKGYLKLSDLIDLLFSKARELEAWPYAIIPQNQQLLIYFRSRR